MSEMTLPEGWCKTDIGSYIYLKNGYAFKSNEYTTPSESSFPVIRISDLDGVTASEKDAVYVLNGAAGFEVQNGDLLIAMSGATTGKIGLYNGQEPAYQNQRVGNLKFHSNKYSCEGFRNYLIQYLRDDILKIAYGGAQPNISGKAIEDMLISLPPLAEQKVIADQLDALLAQVERTKARLERVPDILKQFRQSVLAAAVSGKLTEGWRGKTQYNKTDFGMEIPATWNLITIDDIASVKGGKRLPKGDVLTENDTGYRYIRAGQLKNGTVLNGSDARNKQLFITKETFAQIRKYTVSTGDIYLTIVGASIGDAGVVPKEFDSANLTENAAKLCEFKQEINSEFLGYWLRSQFIQDLIQLEIKSGAQGKLALMRIKTLPFPSTSLEEQTEIVRRVETLFAHADKIEQQAQAGLARVNQLTQSILAKAFRGELTAQWRKDNPELISGENSAEALLVKIAQERGKLGKQKSTKRKIS